MPAIVARMRAPRDHFCSVASRVAMAALRFSGGRISSGSGPASRLDPAEVFGGEVLGAEVLGGPVKSCESRVLQLGRSSGTKFFMAKSGYRAC